MFAQRAIENWSVKLSAFNARQDAAVAEDVDGDGKDAATATATTTSTVRARPDPESELELELERELAVFVLTLNEIICDDCALVAVSSRPRRRQTSSKQRAGGCYRRGGGLWALEYLGNSSRLVYLGVEWRSDVVSWFPWHDFA